MWKEYYRLDLIWIDVGLQYKGYERKIQISENKIDVIL